MRLLKPCETVGGCITTLIPAVACNPFLRKRRGTLPRIRTEPTRPLVPLRNTTRPTRHKLAQTKKLTFDRCGAPPPKKRLPRQKRPKRFRPRGKRAIVIRELSVAVGTRQITTLGLPLTPPAPQLPFVMAKLKLVTAANTAGDPIKRPPFSQLTAPTLTLMPSPQQRDKLQPATWARPKQIGVAATLRVVIKGRHRLPHTP